MILHSKIQRVKILRKTFSLILIKNISKFRKRISLTLILMLFGTILVGGVSLNLSRQSTKELTLSELIDSNNMQEDVKNGEYNTRIKYSKNEIIMELPIVHTGLKQSKFVSGSNWGLSGLAGAPQLPVRCYKILLPPNVEPQSVRMDIIEDNPIYLDEEYSYPPAPFPATSTKEGLVLTHSTDLSYVYEKDEFWPSKFIRSFNVQQMRDAVIAGFSYYPYQYNPVQGKVVEHHEVKILISWDYGDNKNIDSLTKNFLSNLGKDFDNLAEMLPLYEPRASKILDLHSISANNPDSTYVIITTNDIESNSEKLDDFILNKQALGFMVNVITENEYGSATGKQRALNIRNWLQNHYQSDSIKYVLLIGNPDPDDENNSSDSVGDLPMLMCWPRHGSTEDEQAPTDYFYADLTGDWDSDSDNYYGEHSDDSGVDFFPEVYVGRIPVYNSEYSKLDEILLRIMGHHISSGAEKNKILEPMAISNYENEGNKGYERTDGLNCPEEVYNNILLPKGMDDTVMYERVGLEPVPTSAFHYNMSINQSNFISELNQGYGAVFWWGHGGYDSVYRKYWSYDDGDGVPENFEMSWKSFLTSSNMSQLENDQPAFFYQSSCLNGEPETSNNLGYALLKRGAAISTVSASRVSWYLIGTWNSSTYWSQYADNTGIGYYYMDNLLKEEMTAGEALFTAKASGGDGTYSGSWMNKMDFNLYGDPQLSYWGKELSYGPVLKFGAGESPHDLDPQFTYDSDSFDVIDQVCEGLYRYNLSDPDLKIILNLATAFGTWSSDKKNYTVPLRKGVLFHDGTSFNATSVKWSFDRLQYFMNTTGSLPGGTQITQIADLYRLPDGTPIINRTEIINSTTIKFILNKPFVPFLGLLCFSGSYILSPTSTPAYEYIITTTGDLIGTGPFVYDGYLSDINVIFHACEDYWRGEAKFKSLVFKIITDADKRNQALQTGDVDLLNGISFSYLDQMESDLNITVTPCDQSSIIEYLGMNNEQINKTWRTAISYAINYSYIIEELKDGQATRMKSPIPEGIFYANDSFDVATYNLTKAREYMVSMGYGDLGWSNATWQAATFATFNYTYNTDNWFRGNISTLLQNNLDLIGIEVTDKGMSWWEYYKRLLGIYGRSHDMLQLFWIGWSPDYNDPSNFINPLLSNNSINNAAQVNDSYLESWMEAGLEETDPILREAIYDEIQRYIVEDLMPWAFGYVRNYYDAYRSEFTGYPSNPMRKVWLYNMNYVIPVVDSPSDIIYEESTTGHVISWTATDNNPGSYMIYRDNVEVRSGSWIAGVPITINVDGLTVGSYDYTINVTNVYDSSATDLVIVTVEDNTAPSVNSPADIAYEEGTKDHVISWIATDNNPGSYVIYKDGIKVNSSSWTSGVPIIINIDGLIVGSYNYTINVIDVYDYSSTDTVIVTVEDTTAPVVDNPADIAYEEGTTGHIISWNATDNNPGSYVIYKDAIEVNSSSWTSGVSITINIDGLIVGSYNYTINVTDAFNNTAIDTVLVSVTSSEVVPPVIAGYPWIALIFSLCFSISIVILIIKRKIIPKF